MAAANQVFAWEGTDRSGKKTKGEIKSSNANIAKAELRKKGIVHPTIKDVSDAVISIRQSKLPDPKKIGNSGSFFKNPIIKNELFNALKISHTDIVGYPNGASHTKIAAGWLIDNAGLKGYRKADVGVHKNQALVLVNYGNASGKEILNLAKEIQQKIKTIYGISIEPEVNIL